MGNTVAYPRRYNYLETTPVPTTESEYIRHHRLSNTNFTESYPTHHIFGHTFPNKIVEPVNCHVRTFSPEYTDKTCVWNIKPQHLLSGIRAIHFLAIETICVEFPMDNEIDSITIRNNKYHNVLIPRPTIEGNNACVFIPRYLYPHIIIGNINKLVEFRIDFTKAVDVSDGIKFTMRYYQSIDLSNKLNMQVFPSRVKYSSANKMLHQADHEYIQSAILTKNCYGFLDSIAVCVPVQETPIVCKSIVLYAQHEDQEMSETVIPLMEVSGTFASNEYKHNKTNVINSQKYKVYIVNISVDNQKYLINAGAINQSKNERERITWDVWVRATFESPLSNPPILIADGTVITNTCW